MRCSATRYEDISVTLKAVTDRKKVRVNLIVLVSHSLLCYPENYVKQKSIFWKLYFLE